MQHLSKAKRDHNIAKAELDATRNHLEFCMSLYKIQIKSGRCLVHKHPQDAAAALAEESLTRIAAMAGVDMASSKDCEKWVMDKVLNLVLPKVHVIYSSRALESAACGSAFGRHPDVRKLSGWSIE